jgi:hypothetical protein
MKVLMSIMYTNPKEPERNKRRYQAEAAHNPYYEKRVKEGVKWKASQWSDGSGLMLGLHEFDTLEDFNKVWGDKEFQKLTALWSYSADNCKIKIWRPSQSLPPK